MQFYFCLRYESNIGSGRSIQGYPGIRYPASDILTKFVDTSHDQGPSGPESGLRTTVVNNIFSL